MWVAFNQAVCALRFLYRVTLPRNWPVVQIPVAKRPKKLPVVLGHRSFSTTLIYLHVRRPHLESIQSPLDWLPLEQCPRFEEPTPNTALPARRSQEDGKAAQAPPAAQEPPPGPSERPEAPGADSR